MAETLEKITAQDLEGKGVIGQPDVPGLSAAEMQTKIEEIVREVAITKINEIIDWLHTEGASKEDLENVVIDAGAVISVFGRNGQVTAKKGDYTAEQVGAAPEKHAAQHRPDGTDPLSASDFGAASTDHGHGNITKDGKLGNAKGLLLCTGNGGAIEGKSPKDAGVLPEAILSLDNGDIAKTLEENKRYELTDVTSLTIVGAAVNCYGFIKFSESFSGGTITFSNFGGIEDGDDITSAAAGDVFEFNCAAFDGAGYLVINKWGE